MKNIFKKFTPILLGLSLLFSPYSFVFEGLNSIQADEVYENIVIDSDVTWDKIGSPYDFSLTNIAVLPGATLTIEPGVVIKMYKSGISVQGKLLAIGTADEPIIFTSTKDNLDDNDDSLAAPGDWLNIGPFDGGMMKLDNVVVKYGGYISLSVSKNILQKNEAAAMLYPGAITCFGGDLEIVNSKITKNTGGIFFPGGTIVLNNSEITNNSSYGLCNLSEDEINVINNWWGDKSGPYHKEFNPDGLGDKIVGSAIFNPWIGKELTPVILIPGIMGSWNFGNGWKIDPIMQTYDNLWQALREAGYEEDKNLFAFPYNWRYSNIKTAELLKEKINEIKQETGCKKVDIVAHSMGGLVARAYAEGDDYENDIRKLIFLGTPHLGSTKSYLTWEAGEVGVDYLDWVFERLISLEAYSSSYTSLYKYVKGLPMQSVEELLPIYDYLRDADTGEMRSYPDDYPKNTFLEQLNESSAVENLENIEVMNIIGDAGNESTIDILRVANEDYFNGKWEHGCPENYGLIITDQGLEYGAGDGTVSLRSNEGFPADKEIIIENTTHGDMVTDAQEEIIEELTGSYSGEGVYNGFFENLLLVRIFSPADFVVTDPDGLKLGKDFENNSQLNEIPDAFYSGFADDMEFALILNPKEGEYKVELLGTGDGDYKLSTSYIDDNIAVDSDLDGQISINQEQLASFVYQAPTEVTENPISQFELEEEKDITPPTIIINSPQASSTFLHSQTISIDYQVTDDESGVATSTLHLDGKIISTTTVDLFYLKLGEHRIKVFTQDNAQNSTNSEVAFYVTTDFDDTIKDIERAFVLGWFGDSKMKNQAAKILGELKKIIKSAADRFKILEEKNNKPVGKFISWLSQKIFKNKIIKNDKIIQRQFKELKDILAKYLKKKAISQQGYDLLIDDINYLINNL